MTTIHSMEVWRNPASGGMPDRWLGLVITQNSDSGPFRVLQYWGSEPAAALLAQASEGDIYPPDATPRNDDTFILREGALRFAQRTLSRIVAQPGWLRVYNRGVIPSMGITTFEAVHPVYDADPVPKPKPAEQGDNQPTFARGDFKARRAARKRAREAEAKLRIEAEALAARGITQIRAYHRDDRLLRVVQVPVIGICPETGNQIASGTVVKDYPSFAVIETRDNPPDTPIFWRVDLPAHEIPVGVSAASKD